MWTMKFNYERNFVKIKFKLKERYSEREKGRAYRSWWKGAPLCTDRNTEGMGGLIWMFRKGILDKQWFQSLLE